MGENSQPNPESDVIFRKVSASKKVSVSVSKTFGLKKSLSNDLKKFVLDNFGPGNGFIEFGLPTSPNMPNMPNNEQHV